MKRGQARRYRRRMRRLMRRAVTVTFGVFETPAERITVHKIPPKEEAMNTNQSRTGVYQ